MSGDWSTHFCSWCAPPGGCGTCLYSLCCPCCLYGSNVEKLPADAVYCGGSCCGACCCYFLMTQLGCCCLIHMRARAHIRAKYGIAGDGCKDCCCTMCCPLCALCQESRELKIMATSS